MVEIGKAASVGAPGPEQRNSPLYNSSDSDDLSLDLEQGVCFFNTGVISLVLVYAVPTSCCTVGNGVYG